VNVRSTCQAREIFARSFQKPTASPARYAARARGLDDLRPRERHLQDVRLELHQQIVRARAAIHTQLIHRYPESCFITSSISAT
jgi:hypothetical protein